MAWQQTGTMPLTLRLHLRRCHSCRSELRRGQQAVRGAILPLIPAGAIPLAGGGVFSRLYDAAGAHPASQRVGDAFVRARKVAPVGGGGAAALTAKLVAATAVLTATAALHAVTSGHSTRQVHRHPSVTHAAAIEPRRHAVIDVAITTETTTAKPRLEPLKAPAATTTTSQTSTGSSTPPPPNANPAIATRHSTRAAGSSATQTVAAPAPNANAVSASSSSASVSGGSGSGSSSSVSGPPPPGGPPAP
jgi:hypothetical protein